MNRTQGSCDRIRTVAVATHNSIPLTKTRTNTDRRADHGVKPLLVARPISKAIVFGYDLSISSGRAGASSRSPYFCHFGFKVTPLVLLRVVRSR